MATRGRVAGKQTRFHIRGPTPDSMARDLTFFFIPLLFVSFFHRLLPGFTRLKWILTKLN